MIIFEAVVPTVTQGQICTNIVTNLVKEKLRFEMSIKEINTAHKNVKKTINQTPDRRTIIVKFSRRDNKRSGNSASRKTKAS